VRAFVLSLATMVAVAAISPLTDQPETAFNESDTPVNCAIPVSVTTAETCPQETLRVPRPRRTWDGNSRARFIATPLPAHWRAESLRELFCAFLI